MRKFLFNTGIFFSPLAVVVLSVSIYFTYYISPNTKGDLERFGGIIIPRSGEVESYPESPLDNLIYLDDTPQSVRYVNVGDSFSSQGIAGYVNYTAHYLDDKILNIGSPFIHPFDVAVSMLNNGYFKEVGAELVVVESIERLFVGRVLQSDLSANLSIDDIRMLKSVPRKVAKKESRERVFKPFNFKLIFNWVMLKLKSKSTTRKFKLNKDLFTHSSQDLYVYKGDLSVKQIADSTLMEVNSKLDSLYALFAKEGIELVVMCIPDKFDVYQSYTVDAKPKRVLGQFSQTFDHAYYFDVNAVIQPLIESSVKDVYKYNDTHWSPVAADVVGKALAERVKMQPL